MSKIKKTLMSLGLLLALTPLAAQEWSDTTYTFRFVPGRDMFYSPWKGNETELMRMEACVAEWKERILKGEIPVYVEGWCSSKQTKKENLAMAKIRSNRVKSELIVRQGLREDCFITKNHTTDGDYVTVSLKVPVEDTAKAEEAKAEERRIAAEKAKAEAARRAEEARIAAERAAEERRLAAEKAEAERIAREEEVGQAQEVASDSKPKATKKPEDYHFALRSNLLRWATLTPDLGVEWRVNPKWGILVDGSWTSWTWQDKDRRYALWEVTPEVRYYMGTGKCGYLGAMYKAGHFNYKLSDMGKLGDLMGGGLTGGYQLRLNNALSLDFSVALGCLHVDYEQYEVIDGVRVRAGKVTKNWWGPIDAGVTLVWKMF